MKKLAVLSAVIGCMALAQQAQAATIVPSSLGVDFRGSAWTAANNMATHTVGHVSAQALPTGKTLWQDSVDGLGVRIGREADEIDDGEMLKIGFSFSDKLFAGVWVTDLFDAPDGGASGEDGKVDLTLADSSVVTLFFNGNSSDQWNGEQYVDFGGLLDIKQATFYALNGGSYHSGNDFSVAGFRTVPAPLTVALMGAGLVGMGFSMRKRAK